jgi:probable DNA metabolism protein
MNEQGNLFESEEEDDVKDMDKFLHEIHRMMGLLRFTPNEDGIYIARCEPDYMILPALGPYFKERFGNTPWAIIDEKRRLCIRCLNGTLEFLKMDKDSVPLKEPVGGKWESLWRHYHKTINNESRNNPGLQRQFMPRRYWKYLSELSGENAHDG